MDPFSEKANTGIWFSESPAAMAMVRLSDRIHLEVNKAWEAITGYSREEAIGRTTMELGFWTEQVTSQLNALVSQLGSFRSEMTFRNKEGKQCIVIQSSTVVEYFEAPCSLITMIDITKERQNELELERLSRLNVIGEMAAGIGHEVRNPMTTIRGFLQLFRGKEDLQSYRPQLEMMISELDRANQIISEFLAVARTRTLKIRPGLLNHTVGQLFPLLHADGLRFGHELMLDLEETGPALYDEMEIKQLLLNLVRNSFDAMETQGTVTISTYGSRGRIVLEVKDQGGGLPDSVVKNIGKPFVTTKNNGTGIGLSVCFRVAERHGTRLEYETSPHGTRFWLTLNRTGMPESSREQDWAIS